MAAQIIRFPRAHAREAIPFDRTLDAIERLSIVQKRHREHIQEAVYAEHRAEMLEFLRGLGFVCPGDAPRD